MLLDDVKQACGVTDDEYDSRFSDLIETCMIDLGIAGADGEEATTSNMLVKQCIILYCKMYGNIFETPSDFDRLKKAYDENKAQMSMASGYTIWGSDE
jgi:hypothetical protein